MWWLLAICMRWRVFTSRKSFITLCLYPACVQRHLTHLFSLFKLVVDKSEFFQHLPSLYGSFTFHNPDLRCINGIYPTISLAIECTVQANTVTFPILNFC